MTMFRLLLLPALFAGLPLFALAQTPPADAQHANDAAAAAVASGKVTTHAPDFLEHLVDSILGLFNVRTSENTVTHYVIAALFLVGAVLLRRVVTNIIFNYLKKLAAKTETTLDDKLFPAMEAPAATFVMVTGIFSALKVLKLSESTDNYLAAGSTVVVDVSDTDVPDWAPRALSPATRGPMLCWLVEVDPAAVVEVEVEASAPKLLGVVSVEPVVSVVSVDAVDGGG